MVGVEGGLGVSSPWGLEVSLQTQKTSDVSVGSGDWRAAVDNVSRAQFTIERCVLRMFLALDTGAGQRDLPLTAQLLSRADTDNGH